MIKTGQKYDLGEGYYAVEILGEKGKVLGYRVFSPAGEIIAPIVGTLDEADIEVSVHMKILAPRRRGPGM